MYFCFALGWPNVGSWGYTAGVDDGSRRSSTVRGWRRGQGRGAGDTGFVVTSIGYTLGTFTDLIWLVGFGLVRFLRFCIAD